LPFEVRRAQAARARGRLSAMFHVLDTGLYARPSGRSLVAGDGDAPWRGTPDARASRVTREFLREVGAELGMALRGRAVPVPAAAGLVAMTGDRRPVVGLRGDLWVACGFGGDGLALAPAFGEEVAREVLS
ncbi:MAG TPA: FAD-dependent oxidoreductase, partial [Planctomycetota bacterium]|nr:FAD-dependent oxidoreductase [Planctomycetota bacterium]